MKLPIVKTLKNGLVIAYVPLEGVDSVTIHLKGCVGSNYENPYQIGAAHLLEHLKISRNKKIINETGGKVVGVSSRDNILYMSKTLKQDYEISLKFLSKILEKGSYEQTKIDISKKIVQNELNRYFDFPEKLIGRLSHKILFQNQRMAKLNTGDTTDINKLTKENIQSFEQEIYHPNNFVLIACGDLNEKAFFKKASAYFDKFDKGRTAPQLKHTQSKKLLIQSINIQNYDQAFVKIDYYGLPLRDKDQYTLKVASSLLNAHLVALLREQYGYSYKTYCNSFSLGSYGIFSLYFSSKEKDVKDSIELIKSSLSNLNIIITKGNLEAIKKRYLINLVFNLEKVSQRADYYSEYLLHGTKEQNHEYEIEIINKLDVKKVMKIAQKIVAQNPKITILSKSLSQKDIISYWG